MLRKVYLEITNVCNLNCAFCPGTRRPPHFLCVEEFEALTDRLRGETEYLYFHLMGEPLLHPELETFLRIAGHKGFRVLLTTNGTLLPLRGEMLLNADALLKTNISLQSFEANAGGELEEYLGNCLYYAAECVEKGRRCELRLWNQGGLEALNPRIEAMLEAAFPKPWKKSREGWKLAETLWLEPGQHFDWPDLEHEDRGESCFCYALRDQVGVLCDGTVVPCCMDHEGDIPLGNLFTQSLEEILASDRARHIREGFSRRRATEPLCRTCGFARKF